MRRLAQDLGDCGFAFKAKMSIACHLQRGFGRKMKPIQKEQKNAEQ
jgi:hypothetical protein